MSGVDLERVDMPSDTPPHHVADERVADEVAPRLRAFADLLIAELRESLIPFETGPVYLMNSTAHPVEMPTSVNGREIRISFSAEPFAWEFGSRVTFQLNVGARKRKTYLERHPGPTGLPALTIARLIVREVRLEHEDSARRYKAFRKNQEAAESFETLKQQLAMHQDPRDPLLISKDNIRIRCLPDTPSKVILLAAVTHAEAVAITQQYAGKSKYAKPASFATEKPKYRDPAQKYTRVGRWVRET